MTPSLFAVVAVLFTLAGEAPFVAGSIAPTLRPKVSTQTSYTYVQFFGQRWHLVVGYQGSEKIFDYNPDWTVKIIRERAILAFRLTQCQPPLSLFNLSGAELLDTRRLTLQNESWRPLCAPAEQGKLRDRHRLSRELHVAHCPYPRGVIQEGPVPWVRVIRCAAPGAAQKIPTVRNSATDAQRRSCCNARRAGHRTDRAPGSASSAPLRLERQVLLA